MNPGLFTGEQLKALRENPFTDFVSATTIRFTVEFKEMFVAAMDSGKTIRSIFQDSGYAPDVLGRERMKSFAHRVRKEQRKNGGFHNGYKESSIPISLITLLCRRRKHSFVCRTRYCICIRSWTS